MAHIKKRELARMFFRMNHFNEKGRSRFLFVFLFLAAHLIYVSESGAEKPHFQGEKIILEGLAHSYRLELDKAQEVFKKLKLLYPGSPSSLFYPAAISWGAVESDLRWRRIAELHADSKIERELPTHSAERLIKDMRDTITKCAKIIETRPDDFEALFYTAGAYGFTARMEYYSGNYISALIDGKKSADHFEILLNKHPERADAKLGPGVYKYYIGGLSSPMRYLIAMLGLEGSRSEGLDLMETAALRSTLSRVEAADFLTRIYRTSEGDTNKALEWANLLEEFAPGSPLADYHRLIIHHNSGNFSSEAESAEQLLKKMEKLPDSIKGDWEPLLNFTICSAMIEKGDAKKGVEYCRKGYESPKAGNWLKSEIQPHFKRTTVIKNAR